MLLLIINDGNRFLSLHNKILTKKLKLLLLFRILNLIATMTLWQLYNKKCFEKPRKIHLASPSFTNFSNIISSKLLEEGIKRSNVWSFSRNCLSELKLCLQAFQFISVDKNRVSILKNLNGQFKQWVKILIFQFTYPICIKYRATSMFPCAQAAISGVL